MSAFDASTRKFWLPEYEGSELNLAGWTKKVTGKPTITVGSVGLSNSDFIQTLIGEGSVYLSPFTVLSKMFERGDFGLVALGRSLISDPGLVNKLWGRDNNARIQFNAQDLLTLS